MNDSLYYEVEVHNVSVGERRIVQVKAKNPEDAFEKAMRRKDMIRDMHKGYLFTFRVEEAMQ